MGVKNEISQSPAIPSPSRCRDADILKANVLFRAVAVARGPGNHHVHFAFEPFRGAFDELLEKAAAR
jgi:hypothetical protein